MSPKYKTSQEALMIEFNIWANKPVIVAPCVCDILVQEGSGSLLHRLVGSASAEGTLRAMVTNVAVNAAMPSVFIGVILLLLVAWWAIGSRRRSWELPLPIEAAGEK
jgi:hypothetical protein